MKLSCGHIRPGKVIKNVDSMGTIKGSCAGVFSIEDDPDMLPPIYPFLKTSPTQFVKPNIGDDIWVIFFSDNPQELFYVFQGSIDTKTSKSIEQSTESLDSYSDNVQVLMSCDSGFNGAELSFSNKDGWKMSNDNSEMTIGDDNTVTIKNDNGELIMDTDGIHLSGAEHAVARGDVVADRFMQLESMMKMFANSLKGNPYTASAGAALEGLMETYMKDYDEIESPNVTTK